MTLVDPCLVKYASEGLSMQVYFIGSQVMQIDLQKMLAENYLLNLPEQCGPLEFQVSFNLNANNTSTRDGPHTVT